MKRINLINYLPLIVTTGIVVYSIIETKTRVDIEVETGLPITYAVIDSIVYSAIGLGFVIGMAIFKIRYWKHFFMFLLIAATLGFVQFYPVTTGFNFGFFKIQITGLIMLLFHSALNNEPWLDLKNNLGTPDFSKTMEEFPKESEIEGFQKKFASKSQLELLEIVESGHYNPSAVEAAKRLMKDMKPQEK